MKSLRTPRPRPQRPLAAALVLAAGVALSGCAGVGPADSEAEAVYEGFPPTEVTDGISTPGSALVATWLDEDTVAVTTRLYSRCYPVVVDVWADSPRDLSIRFEASSHAWPCNGDARHVTYEIPAPSGVTRTQTVTVHALDVSVALFPAG